MYGKSGWGEVDIRDWRHHFFVSYSLRMARMRCIYWYIYPLQHLQWKGIIPTKHFLCKWLKKEVRNFPLMLSTVLLKILQVSNIGCFNLLQRTHNFIISNIHWGFLNILLYLFTQRYFCEGCNKWAYFRKKEKKRQASDTQTQCPT